MLNRILILFVFSTLVFSSCSKSDDDVAAGSSSGIVGKWTMSAITVNLDAKSINATPAAIKENYDSANPIYDFKSDNSLLIDGESYKYTFDASKKSVVIDYDDFKEVLTTEISGNSMKLLTSKIIIEPVKPYTEDSPELSVFFDFLAFFSDQEAALEKLGVKDAKTMQIVYSFKK